MKKYFKFFIALMIVIYILNIFSKPEIIFAYPKYDKDVDREWVKGDDGKPYWYEKGIRQGTYEDKKCIMGDGTCRGREIYDPESDAWYWLDSVYDGAKAENKEVWIPYIFQDEKPGSTEGKWVRYDKNGAMIKGWYENDNGKYYYDLITGAMYKGKNKINGKNYIFDEQTGILKTGIYEENGKKYFYDENGIKQFGQIYYEDYWYMFDMKTGEMLTGFFDHTKKTNPEGEKKVYYDEDGHMVYGPKKIKDNWYMFRNITGEMVTGFNIYEEDNKTYYYDEEGKMLFGNQEINKNTYYFNKTLGILESINEEEFVDGMKVSMIKNDKLKWKDGIPSYENSTLGIDVSSHQGKIDWEKVKEDDVEFVFLRAAWRGYGSKGILYNDAKFEENYIGAKNAGLKIGVYVFSQAINEAEAIEEANLVLELTKDKQIDLGYVYDLEDISYNEARTDYLSATQWTNNALAFLNVIDNAGKKGILYTNLNWYKTKYYMTRLYKYDVWLAQYNTKNPTFPLEYKVWQFSENGRVDGINTRVDMNIMFN